MESNGNLHCLALLLSHVVLNLDAFRCVRRLVRGEGVPGCRAEVVGERPGDSLGVSRGVVTRQHEPIKALKTLNSGEREPASGYCGGERVPKICVECVAEVVEVGRVDIPERAVDTPGV